MVIIIIKAAVEVIVKARLVVIVQARVGVGVKVVIKAKVILSLLQELDLILVINLLLQDLQVKTQLFLLPLQLNLRVPLPL